jgi:hypothetical protein
VLSAVHWEFETMHHRSSAEVSNGVHVRLQSELARALDDCRRAEADVPSRPEMVRRLLRQAVTARQAEADVGDDERASEFNVGMQMKARPART